MIIPEESVPLSELAIFFQEKLFPLPSYESLLNPYSYQHPNTDQPNAPKIRQRNLLNYLSHFEDKPRYLIIGEAPGPWGCRFSGVPFTSERQLAQGELPFNGKPTSIHNPPVAERSATIFWDTLKPYHQDFLVCNSIPLLPHKPNDPQTLRPPKRTEIREFQFILAFMIEQLQPETILAVGRRAEEALHMLKQPSYYVRHPSHGGKGEFIKTLVEFFPSNISKLSLS
jgi:uracil-DNA glycosylase